MVFEQIPIGGDRNFAYLIGDEESGKAAVVDPAFNPQRALERVNAHNLTVVFLINTHAHYDHAGGNDLILSRTGAQLLAGGHGGVPDNHKVVLGQVELSFIHTPGHTQDSICVLVTEPGSAGKLVTGDTLFVGKIGGTGFGDDARAEYDSLHEKLMILPDKTEVWPGHDYGVAPSSTIGNEKRTNPFILRENFDDFVHLKRNWAEYKRKHGIK